MQMAKDRKATRRRIRYGIRRKLSGTGQRPRVAVFRSLNNIYLQAVDDDTGVTLTSASSLEPELRKKLKGKGGGVAAAKEVGAAMAKKLKEKKLTTAVFDRGGFIYHGRVKAAAEAMREGGIKI